MTRTVNVNVKSKLESKAIITKIYSTGMLSHGDFWVTLSNNPRPYPSSPSRYMPLSYSRQSSTTTRKKSSNCDIFAVVASYDFLCNLLLQISQLLVPLLFWWYYSSWLLPTSLLSPVTHKNCFLIISDLGAVTVFHWLLTFLGRPSPSPHVIRTPGHTRYGVTLLMALTPFKQASKAF